MFAFLKPAFKIGDKVVFGRDKGVVVAIRGWWFGWTYGVNLANYPGYTIDIRGRGLEARD